LIVGFIDEYRQVYGVELIWRALTEHGVQIAPRTYRKAHPWPPSDRDIADAYWRTPCGTGKAGRRRCTGGGR
jgi:putative transposase